MDERLREIVDDLEAEQAALGDLLDTLEPADWDRDTHAPGWLVRDQVTHLAQFDEAARLGWADPEGFREQAERERQGPGSFEERYLAEGRAMTPGELLARWRAASNALVAAARESVPPERVPWYGPAMSPASFLTARLMETWSHGLDVADAVAADAPQTDRLRHIAFIAVRARPFSYQNRGMDVPAGNVFVQLHSPGGQVWEFGDSNAENRVSGDAYEFCCVLTRRRHVDDTLLAVEGPLAREWMEIGQAFAGPPGEGRQPGQFGRKD